MPFLASLPVRFLRLLLTEIEPLIPLILPALSLKMADSSAVVFTVASLAQHRHE